MSDISIDVPSDEAIVVLASFHPEIEKLCQSIVNAMPEGTANDAEMAIVAIIREFFHGNREQWTVAAIRERLSQNEEMETGNESGNNDQADTGDDVEESLGDTGDSPEAKNTIPVNAGAHSSQAFASSVKREREQQRKISREYPASKKAKSDGSFINFIKRSDLGTPIKSTETPGEMSPVQEMLQRRGFSSSTKKPNPASAESAHPKDIATPEQTNPMMEMLARNGLTVSLKKDHKGATTDEKGI